MSERIPCLNPCCRRTAAATTHPGCEEIVCGKCWRTLPGALRTRYKNLRARDRRISRLFRQAPYRARADRIERRAAGVQAALMAAQFERLWEANWAAIRAFFQPTEKPAGLDTVLKELGLS